MDVNEFQQLSKRTMPEPQRLMNGQVWYTKEQFANYAMGIAGEAGELVDDMKKELFHDHPVDIVKKKKEIGDLMHYVAGLCTMYDISLEEVFDLNIEKLKKRYPNGFNSEDSIKRADVNGDK